MYEDRKSFTIGSILSGHEGALATISDSVDPIRENVDVAEDTNDKIDNASAELDRIISED